MFATNKTEGSQGPWMTWTSNGSAEKGFAPRSWVMRGKDENDQTYARVVEGFTRPCVFDLDSLKLGWEKDGAHGPERVYSSHYSVPMQRPDESRKPNNAFVWSNCLQVRVALSKDQAATWEQGSYGAYQGAVDLFRQIEARYAESQNGRLLPVVQMTDVRVEKLKSGSTNIPVLTLVKWVERPAVLTDAAPTFATQQATPAPAPAPTPAPQPAVAAADDFDTF